MVLDHPQSTYSPRQFLEIFMLMSFAGFSACGTLKKLRSNAFECDRRFCEPHAHMSELVTMSGASWKRKRRIGTMKKRRHLGHPTALRRGIRKCLMNGRQSVSLLNGSRWRIFTCEPVALQLTDDNGMKEARIRLEGIRTFVWLNGLRSSTSVTPISFAGFSSDKCRLQYCLM